jgi:predicted nucleic acid-binding protein
VSVRRHLRLGRVATSRISTVEIASARARRERERAFTASERDRAITRLNADLAAWVLVELTAELTADAQSLVVRHALRTGDAIQLASALHLKREIGQRMQFAAFDDRLTDAASAEGLTVMHFR